MASEEEIERKGSSSNKNPTAIMSSKNDDDKKPTKINQEQEKKGSSSNKKPAKISTAESKAEIKQIKIMVEKLVLENKQLKEKVHESLMSNDFINAKFEENKKVNEEVLKKLNEITTQNQKLIEKNEHLEKQIEIEKEERIKLEERIYAILNPIELKKRSKNLEIHGLPEDEKENCQDAVTLFLQKVTPKPLAVEQCYRSGKRFKLNGEKNTRPIVVKFKNQEDRDTALASRNNLVTENQKLYLNVNLPPYLKMLRGKANALRKQKGYKYLWMKDGNFLLRKNEGANVIVINKLSDLEKII